MAGWMAMADQLQTGVSPSNDATRIHATIEDDKTRATRLGLKESSMSSTGTYHGDQGHDSAGGSSSSSSSGIGIARERLASPKKKRAHDQLDHGTESRNNDAKSVASIDHFQDRALRLEPEKKRHRDQEPSESTVPEIATLGATTTNNCTCPSQDVVFYTKCPSSADTKLTSDVEGDEAPTTTGTVSKSSELMIQKAASIGDRNTVEMPTSSSRTVPKTSASAFAASGFSKLAQNPSAFAALGSPASSLASLSTESALSSPASTKRPQSPSVPAMSAPRLTFCSTSGASPFAGLTTNGFGGGLGFSSCTSGLKSLGRLAAPGKVISRGKPAKPFGAPDSDSEGAESDAESVYKERDIKNDVDEKVGPVVDDGSILNIATANKEPEDKKKTKLHKGKDSRDPDGYCTRIANGKRAVVAIDDGETGEVTVLSLRSKMFSLDKNAGWKERGAGMLKINVPRSCVERDGAGVPIAESFNALEVDSGGKYNSGILEDKSGRASEGHRGARLIMRQDQTHRVILNTAIVPAMQFREKASLKSVAILFTAFEGSEAKPVSVTIKMSAANAKVFLQKIQLVQRILKEK